MDRIGSRAVAKNIRALSPSRGRARSIGAQYGFAVGYAGRQMERHPDAHALWRESARCERWDGAGSETTRAGVSDTFLFAHFAKGNRKEFRRGQRVCRTKGVREFQCGVKMKYGT